MSQMFKPGDLVVCVDDTETLGKLEHGKTYKVIKSDAYFTFLEGLRDSNNGFYSRRFELVEEKPEESKAVSEHKFKIGDKVKCIAAYYELTKGITYTVEDLGKGLLGNKTIKLVEAENYWSEDRFELVKPEEIIKPTFKVGDVVEAFGCEGLVKQIAEGCNYPVQEEIMKTNPNDAAFSTSLREFGLTKLEYFAAAALPGLLASLGANYGKYHLARLAVEQAKALIDELNEQEGVSDETK